MADAHPDPARPLSHRENCVIPGDKPERAQTGRFSRAGDTPLGALLSSSFSAEDLRCLDVEKEKQDASSPRGVIEGCINTLEPETDSSKPKSTESTTDCSNTKTASRWHGFLNLWRGRSVKRLPTFPPFLSKGWGSNCKSTRENMSVEMVNPDVVDHFQFQSSWKNFTLGDLETATDNFSQENMIGRGGYAEVYKGCLLDGQLIAVKRLNNGTQEEKTAGFLSELGIIAHVNHPNTAKLIGYGVEGGLHLVIQLSKRGSLALMLHDSEEKLDWYTRYKIALGTADGLEYLHENCQRRIIHRDIKAANILVTEDYEPQICDYGLAKWLPRQWSHRNVTKFEGTFGYFAPEYFMHGIIDEKTDVFAFGVLLLELITGRRAMDPQRQSIVVWAKPLLDGSKLRELVDPLLNDAYDIEELERLALTASLCTEQSPVLRPQMSQVAILLRNGSYGHRCVKNRPNERCLRRTYSEELWDAEEYNSTRYLSDLKRHKQVAFGN